MQANDIELYLTDLGQELQQQGIQTPIRVLVVGGALLLLAGINRPATSDIDIVFKDTDDPARTPWHTPFTTAVRQVANRQGLVPNWINEVIGDAIRDLTLPPDTLHQQYGVLEVYFPSLEYMLALKLFSGRIKDRLDITQLLARLNVTTRQQAQDILDRYIPQPLQMLNDVNLTLDFFFP
jgi:hypothetical protein